MYRQIVMLNIILLITLTFLPAGFRIFGLFVLNLF